MIEKIRRGLSDIVFPRVCVCCGIEHTSRQRQLCSFCLQERFEDANPDNAASSSDTLLPEGVKAQHALWKFDKGGKLQDLLHLLKYEGLTDIGTDLGRKLGERLRQHPLLATTLDRPETILVPVPLHYLKYRYRGFNQAWKIARGLQQVWPLPICGIKSVVRTKNTRTQTGFSLDKRLQNMNEAFEVKQGPLFTGKTVVIVDDVFTTGATTFELARTLLKGGAASAVILTVAQA